MSEASSLGDPANLPSTEPESAPTGSSYGQIFKSTAFTGGASVISIFLGIFRTKVMALLLGPSGVGLIGLYMTITGIASMLAGMGIGTSGVRQIAEAAASEDRRSLARTNQTLQRTSLILGIAGALLLVAVSYPASVVTFGDGSHALAIAGLALAIFFGAVTGGQGALIQGLRRIGDLAQLNILGTLAGTLIGLPLIWFFRERGIVPMLVALPAAGLVFSWWFVRRIAVEPGELNWMESARDARTLLALGVAFMGSGLLSAAVTYLIRLLIVRELGLEAAGHYSAAFMLAGIYSGFILQAMGTDFFPRLTAVSGDHSAVNRLVNEQTEIALLMAVPGILGTLLFAPWVIRLFYAGAFDPAVAVLQWQVVGILGRVISWPMGFIILAKGRRVAFLWTEVAANGMHVGLCIVGIHYFRVEGTGMAFAAMYLFYCVLVMLVSRAVTGFRWSRLNLQMLAWMLPLVAAVFLLMRHFPRTLGLPIGTLATLIGSLVCLKGLVRRMPQHRMGPLSFLVRWANQPRD